MKEKSMKAMIKSVLVVVSVLTNLYGQNLFAQVDDIVTYYADGVSQDENAGKAQSDAFKDAINKGSMQAINQLIGGSRIEKSLPAIKTKILPQWGKYVQYYKATDPKVKNGETSVQVQMRVSLSSLREVLGGQGLLFQNDGKVYALPLIKFIDHRDRSPTYKWWMDDGTATNLNQREALKSFFGTLESQLKSKGFNFVEGVQKLQPTIIPDIYRREQLSLDELKGLAEYFKAQVVITGEVHYETTATGDKMNFSTAVINTLNSHQVIELTKNFDEVVKDPLPVKAIKKFSAPYSSELAVRLAEES
jgi:hypothetical protein